VKFKGHLAYKDAVADYTATKNVPTNEQLQKQINKTQLQRSS